MWSPQKTRERQDFFEYEKQEEEKLRYRAVPSEWVARKSVGSEKTPFPSHRRTGGEGPGIAKGTL